MNRFLLSIVFVLAMFTSAIYFVPKEPYNYLANIQDILFSTCGYLSSFLLLSGADHDKTTKHLLKGILLLCGGSIIANVLDINYAYNIWGQMFPILCGILFISGIKKMYGY